MMMMIRDLWLYAPGVIIIQMMMVLKVEGEVDRRSSYYLQKQVPVGSRLERSSYRYVCVSRHVYMCVQLHV